MYETNKLRQLVDRRPISQFTAAVNGHHEEGSLNSIKMLKSGQGAIHTHVSKWTISQDLGVQT